MKPFNDSLAGYSRDSKLPFDSMSEECGVFGIYSHHSTHNAPLIFYGLMALQHRGQESAGIAVAHKQGIEKYKAMGLVNEVFSKEIIDGFPAGHIGIGHVRYSTTGASLQKNAQPLAFMGKAGKISLAHNGNIVNADEIREGLIKEGVMFQTTIDSEVIASLINKHSDEGLEQGIIKASQILRGSYCLVVMTEHQLFAVRDNLAMRPLALGKTKDGYAVASETCALNAVGAEFVKDLEAGEIMAIDKEGLRSTFMPESKYRTCSFEYVYFARQDSIIDGKSVYEARKRSGRILAERYGVEADIVAGVPDTALVAAQGYAEASGLPYVDILSKNRYVGRTFIQPSQEMREQGVMLKLNVISNNVAGKRIVLLDDSIVRGTTSRILVEMLRKAGAKEVHLRVCSPIVKHPCYFGIDTQHVGELLGSKISVDKMKEQIGCDSLAFLEVEELSHTVIGREGHLCKACFDGNYPMELGKNNCKTKLE